MTKVTQRITLQEWALIKALRWADVRPMELVLHDEELEKVYKMQRHLQVGLGEVKQED